MFPRGCVADLVSATNTTNVNIPQMADTLFERATNASWVVVFKALVTSHHMCVHGNEVSGGDPGRPVSFERHRWIQRTCWMTEKIQKQAPITVVKLKILFCCQCLSSIVHYSCVLCFFLLFLRGSFSTWPPGPPCSTSAISSTKPVPTVRTTTRYQTVQI